jgi:hypothetical protein
MNLGLPQILLKQEKKIPLHLFLQFMQPLLLDKFGQGKYIKIK